MKWDQENLHQWDKNGVMWQSHSYSFIHSFYRHQLNACQRMAASIERAGLFVFRAPLMAQSVKNLPANQEDLGSIPG